MAVKTITIDLAAYEMLAAEKRGNESFSKVIKRRLGPTKTAKRLLEVLPDIQVSEESLAHMEEIVRARKDSPALSPSLDSFD